MVSNKPRCQCTPNCKRQPLPNSNSPFCSVHQSFCPRKAPLSGFEPDYDPERWNSNLFIRKSHNCYMYALNIQDPVQIEKCMNTKDCNVPFDQPGNPSGHPKFTDRDPKTCPNLILRLKGDNPFHITPSTFEHQCPNGSSKIALIGDEDQDYHFLRQDSNGYFSQKSGSLPVSNVDASGRMMYDVSLADHDWSIRGDPLHYDNFCGYFCVSRTNPFYVKSGGGYKRTRRNLRKRR